MTAYAMTGDREKSLAAGMNDHITKPFQPPQLYATLNRWIAPRTRQVMPDSVQTAGQMESVSLPDQPAIDVETGLVRSGGSLVLYRRILRKFAENEEATADNIRIALDAGDIATANRLAHSLKGSAGAIGAEPLRAAAGLLENALMQGDEAAY